MKIIGERRKKVKLKKLPNQIHSYSSCETKGAFGFAYFLFLFSVKIENRHENMFGLILLKIFHENIFINIQKFENIIFTFSVFFIHLLEIFSTKNVVAQW